MSEETKQPEQKAETAAKVMEGVALPGAPSKPQRGLGRGLGALLKRCAASTCFASGPRQDRASASRTS